eukprot:9283375-Alexandrium_andersonii.AAC.1
MPVCRSSASSARSPLCLSTRHRRTPGVVRSSRALTAPLLRQPTSARPTPQPLATQPSRPCRQPAL